MTFIQMESPNPTAGMADTNCPSHRQTKHVRWMQSKSNITVWGFAKVKIVLKAAARGSTYSCCVFWEDNDRRDDFMSFIHIFHNPQSSEVKLEVCLYGWKHRLENWKHLKALLTTFLLLLKSAFWGKNKSRELSLLLSPTLGCGLDDLCEFSPTLLYPCSESTCLLWPLPLKRP